MKVSPAARRTRMQPVAATSGKKIALCVALAQAQVGQCDAIANGYSAWPEARTSATNSRTRGGWVGSAGGSRTTSPPAHVAPLSVCGVGSPSIAVDCSCGLLWQQGYTIQLQEGCSMQSAAVLQLQ